MGVVNHGLAAWGATAATTPFGIQATGKLSPLPLLTSTFILLALFPCSAIPLLCLAPLLSFSFPHIVTLLHASVVGFVQTSLVDQMLPLCMWWSHSRDWAKIGTTFIIGFIMGNSLLLPLERSKLTKLAVLPGVATRRTASLNWSRLSLLTPYPVIGSYNLRSHKVSTGWVSSAIQLIPQSSQQALIYPLI
jgi:hypothetical protein